MIILSKNKNKNDIDSNINMYQKEEKELEILIEEFSKVKNSSLYFSIKLRKNKKK